MLLAYRDGAQGLAQTLGAALDAMPRPDVTCLSAALWYADQGLHVFPVRAGEKVPHGGTRGCLDATDDPDQIKEWWQRWPDSNVAIATGHIVDVIDFDGVKAHKAWSARFPNDTDGETYARRPVLGTVLTPRLAGLHVYVPARGGGNAAGLVEGVDHRGRGGYVVAPPSRTAVGEYRWLRPMWLTR